MKRKILISLMVASLAIGIVGCGNSTDVNSADAESESTAEEESESSTDEVTYKLGETVSTDLADFTLDAATFSYYANANSASLCEPIDEDDGGIFVASLGHALVPLTFTINNKDRDHLNIGYMGDWKLCFTVIYNGEEYPLNGFDLTYKPDGNTSGLNLSYCAVSFDGGKSFEKHDSSNEFQYSGEETYRAVGVVSVDPESLDDSFELRVQVKNSAGEYEYFTYVVE